MGSARTVHVITANAFENRDRRVTLPNKCAAPSGDRLAVSSHTVSRSGQWTALTLRSCPVFELESMKVGGKIRHFGAFEVRPRDLLVLHSVHHCRPVLPEGSYQSIGGHAARHRGSGRRASGGIVMAEAAVLPFKDALALVRVATFLEKLRRDGCWPTTPRRAARSPRPSPKQGEAPAPWTRTSAAGPSGRTRCWGASAKAAWAWSTRLEIRAWAAT
jgi:hypothetical protein